MEQLLKYAQKRCADKIIGTLSWVDEKPENIERRNHFYKKFGFSFCEDGTICLNMHGS